MNQYPKCVYRRKDGEIESKIIDAPPVPDGWCESPADVDKTKPERVWTPGVSFSKPKTKVKP